MTLALVKTPAKMLDHFQRQLDDHADDPISGACPICRRGECQPYREARGELAMAGKLAWDPIEEDRRRRLWVATLEDR